MSKREQVSELLQTLDTEIVGALLAAFRQDRNNHREPIRGCYVMEKIAYESLPSEAKQVMSLLAPLLASNHEGRFFSYNNSSTADAECIDGLIDSLHKRKQVLGSAPTSILGGDQPGIGNSTKEGPNFC